MGLSIPFFRKKEEVKAEIKSVVVMFNIVNHASLIAAVLYATLLRERSSLDVTLVDIRDVIPRTADKYVWMDCGYFEDFKVYFEAAAMNNSKARNWAMDMKDKAVFLVSTKANDRTVIDTVIGMAYEEIEKDEITSLDDRLLFSRYAVLSEAWLTNGIDAESATAYALALQWCYHHYLGKVMTVETLRDLLRSNSNEVEEYLQDQKAFNRAMGSRCRPITIANRSAMYITSTGPEIFGIIRRIALTKQEFIHVTEGSYARVVYASLAVPDTALESRRIFKLMPEIEPLK